MINYSSV